MPDPAPPLLVKIAPDMTQEDLADVAAVATGRGLAGIIVSNTTVARPATLRGSIVVRSQPNWLLRLP